MGSTVAATLLTFQFKGVLTAFRSAYFVFSSPKQDPQELINTMIMLGTLIGLIQMLSLLADLESLGPAMAIALLTTFYGSLLATVIFLPVAGKLRSRIQGAVSILQDNNPMSVYEKLSSFVPAKKRKPMQKLKDRS